MVQFDRGVERRPMDCSSTAGSSKACSTSTHHERAPRVPMRLALGTHAGLNHYFPPGSHRMVRWHHEPNSRWSFGKKSTRVVLATPRSRSDCNPRAAGGALLKAGEKTWWFVCVDYVFVCDLPRGTGSILSGLGIAHRGLDYFLGLLPRERRHANVD